MGNEWWIVRSAPSTYYYPETQLFPLFPCYDFVSQSWWGGCNVFLTFYAISNISRTNHLRILNNYISFNVFFVFLAPLCHLAAELFKCRDLSVVVVVGGGGGGVNFKGGRANLRNASVTFSLFWHEASLG